MSRRACRIRARREPQHVLAAEEHLAGRRLDQPQDAASGRALAAARLADEPEHLAFLDREADVVDGPDDRRRAPESLLADEVLDEVADLEERHQRTVRRQPRGPAPCPAPRPAASACSRGRASRRIWRTGPASTSRPLYMTATRSAISAMTPKSCVMSSSARLYRASQLAQQVEHLRLDGDVERGRRLVGNDERRLAGERDGDHHALPHAAGELMRVVADAARRRRDVHGVEQLDGARSRAVAGRPGRAPSAPRQSDRRRASPG